MQTFDQSILKLFEAGLITEETALGYASHKSVARRGIDDLKKKQGLMTSDIEELALDADYGRGAFRRRVR
jgi:twitching motility protein PilT